MSLFSNFDGPAFSRALQALLPSGRAFPRDPGSVQTAVLQGIADGFFETHQVAVNLLDNEANPADALALLAEWEADYGLPDPCTPLDPTVQQRRAALLGKIAADPGGQSIAYFVNVAAQLGFAITIDEFDPFTVDMPVDEPLYGPDWRFVWQVNAPQITTHYFTVDDSSVDDPLETYDNDELACRLTALKPAQTLLLFNFS